jgi:hypothetical protein
MNTSVFLLIQLLAGRTHHHNPLRLALAAQFALLRLMASC